MFGRNVALGRPLRISPWRKIAIATWDAPTQSSVYGVVEVPVAAALQSIDELKNTTGKKITISHFIAKAIAQTAHQNPELNCLIRFGKIYPRKEVRVFFMVASDDSGEDLSGLVLTNPHLKTIAEIADEMGETKQRIRTKEDKAHARMKGLMDFLPTWFSYYLMKLMALVLYTLNLWTSLLGLPKDPFGAIMVTNFGSLGVDAGFAPLVPYTRAPFIFAVGKIKEEVRLKEGKVYAEKILPFFITYDHRYLDGVQGARIIRTLRGLFENPKLLA